MLAVTNTSRTININQATTVKCVHTRFVSRDHDGF